ncbi:MAG: ABC transporter permease [Candidatus Woesearchaeota archaeon]|nr:ABC transporter permease [Candidatus Woesearchaeota archaeon]
MHDIIELVRKNLKNFLRAKAGSLIVILGPLIVIFLAGLAFDNSNVYAVKIGTYRPEAEPATTALLDQLRDQFKVAEYDTKDKCINAIKNTDINTCMLFDANFTIGVPNKNQITFYVDYSRINLVWTIMQKMTEQVGEKSIQASQNLTKVILNTIDYTQKRMKDQRAAVIKLATQNELMLQNNKELIAELGDVNLGFDENGFQVNNLASSRTQIKQWMDSALTVSEKGLSKSSSFIAAANDLVKASGASQEAKDKLTASLASTLDEIVKLKADMTEMKTVTQESFKQFDSQVQAINQAITDTKTNLQQADTSRQMGLRVLEATTKLLDQSLLTIAEIQQIINDVDNKINAIEIKDPNAITQPIVTSIKPIVQEKTYLNYIFPVLIVLVIMFTALLITPTLILLDKHSPASFRSYMTPVKDSSYIIANFITAFIILMIQVIIIMAIASVFFSQQVLLNIPEAIFLLAIISSLFILMGMILGYLFNNEETATLAGVSIGALFLFISDVIIPIESMPEAFAYIASFNPYVLGSSLIRRALLFNSSILNLYGDVLIMLGYIVAAALVASGVYMITRNYSLEQLTKKLTPVLVKLHLKRK